MVLIGFDKSIPVKEAVDFLLENGIAYVGHEYTERVKKYAHQSAYEENMIFLEVETEELHENGLCALGGQREINMSAKRLTRGCTEEGTLLIEELTEVIGSVLARMLDDADMWLDIVKKFTERFGMTALRRDYNDMTKYQNEPIIRTAESINVYYDEVTFEDLTNLNFNQTIVVLSSVG